MSTTETRIKITEEAQKLGGHARIFADYIIHQLLTCDKNAAEIAAKSLAGAVTYVKNQAQKVAKDSMAVIEDNEVYGWIREYYEISDLTVAKPAPQPEPSSLSIFDLME